MQCKDTQPHITHRYITRVLLLNTPPTLTLSCQESIKKKENKARHPGRKGFSCVYNFLCASYASSPFLALFIYLSVLTGLLYYMWINRLWCHILTSNCVTFMFKLCTAILFGDKHKSLLLVTWRKRLGMKGVSVL